MHVMDHMIWSEEHTQPELHVIVIDKKTEDVELFRCDHESTIDIHTLLCKPCHRETIFVTQYLLSWVSHYRPHSHDRQGSLPVRDWVCD